MSCKCNLKDEKIENPKILNPDIEGDASEVIEEEIYENIEVYSEATLPEDAILVGESPILNEETIFPSILGKHMTPKNKYAYINVITGKVQFVYEDKNNIIYTVTPDHPLVIEPERYHHVILMGPVTLTLRFYKVPELQDNKSLDETAIRPGEFFLNKD